MLLNAGPDPDGFMKKDEIVAYLESYVAHFRPPLVEGVEVTRLARDGARFVLTTTRGTLTAAGRTRTLVFFARPPQPSSNHGNPGKQGGHCQ